MNDIYKGQLIRWNENKGFGFISPENGKRDIFIHISALKRMSRKPIVGDVIFYQIHTDNTGKSRAVNARIEGVAAIKAKERKNNRDAYKKDNWFVQIIFVIIIVIVGFEGYKKFKSHQVISSPEIVPISDIYKEEILPPEIESQIQDMSGDYREKYECNGKTHCSQMTSCEEATFYQNNCPGTKMDGDGDGIPCENQWCGR
ncbi:MAG: excalibur calcium-binding domain-containing protein [Methylococcales bacterium]|nr:excalibur calcium-binding domain-containing protein [Methylococcales bacterium]